MDNKELRIRIDANGNIHREYIEPQVEEPKPGLLKRLVPGQKRRACASH